MYLTLLDRRGNNKSDGRLHNRWACSSQHGRRERWFQMDSRQSKSLTYMFEWLYHVHTLGWWLVNDVSTLDEFRTETTGRENCPKFKFWLQSLTTSANMGKRLFLQSGNEYIEPLSDAIAKITQFPLLHWFFQAARLNILHKRRDDLSVMGIYPTAEIPTCCS